MTITERIFEKITEKNLKPADLARILGIKNSVISNWKKRNTTPPMEYTLHICEFLGITVEELINGKESLNLSPEEQQILEAYRNADPMMKAGARKLLDLPDLPQGKSFDCEIGKESHVKK